MARGSFSTEQAEFLSRKSIKQLVKKYNDSKGQDKQTLTMIIEQLAQTPLYFVVEKGSDTSDAGKLRFITLSTGGQVFIPAFTDDGEFGKLSEAGDAVLIQPEDYLGMLSANNCHAVINPFGSYFLMWPELVTNYLLPFIKQKKDIKGLAN